MWHITHEIRFSGKCKKKYVIIPSNLFLMLAPLFNGKGVKQTRLVKYLFNVHLFCDSTF